MRFTGPMPTGLNQGRFTLTPIDAATADIEQRLSEDEEVPRWTFYPAGMSTADAERRARRSLRNGLHREGQRYVIREGRSVLGTAGIATQVDGFAEVFYALLPDARGRGAASAAVRALTRWAFAAQLPLVQATTLVGNRASERVLRAAGFLPVGLSADARDGQTLRVWVLAAPARP